MVCRTRRIGNWFPVKMTKSIYYNGGGIDNFAIEASCGGGRVPKGEDSSGRPDAEDGSLLLYVG
jgi:hypothetical protein